MMGGPRRRGAPMPRMSIKGQGHILKRLMKIVFENYLWQFIAVIVCIVVTAYATIQSSTFTRDLVDVYIAGIQKGTKTMGDLANAMIPLGCVLALGVAASYIRQRLMHSRLLLISTSKSISEIGNECTFPNTSHFIKLFKKEYQMTPATYRHKHLTSLVPEPALNETAEAAEMREAL